jgi:hypothetical protein
VVIAEVQSALHLTADEIMVLAFVRKRLETLNAAA